MTRTLVNSHAIDPSGAQTGADGEDFWKGATFMPHDQSARIEALLGRVWKSRQSAFLAFGLKIAFAESKLYKETTFGASFEAFKSMSPERRRQLVEFPLFLIWLKQSIDLASDPKRLLASDPKGLKDKLDESRRVIEAFEKSGNNRHLLMMQDLTIQVERFDIDPLIAEVALPDYQLPNQNRQLEFEKLEVYPYSFFVGFLTLALERIKQAWPEAYKAFPKFVKMVVDMIDGDITSYSAPDHTGVIFVSTDTSPVVALEEYLIHEFGHQILYHVMELDALVDDETGSSFTLPWSGNIRNFYGYFHAFYIYILMALYLLRVKERSKREQKRVSSRITHVVKGLTQAVTDLESAGCFTPRGRDLFKTLKSEVQQLKNYVDSSSRHTLATANNSRDEGLSAL